MSNDSKYKKMALAGKGPCDVYLEARNDGLKFFQIIKLLRDLFDLSMAEAKEITIVAEGSAANLSEYQEKLLPGLIEAQKTISSKDSEDDPGIVD